MLDLFSRSHPSTTPPAPHPIARWQQALWLGLFALSLGTLQPAWAIDSTADKPTPATVSNSELDGTLFYQILVAETSLNNGDQGSAYQLYLEAARRHHNNQLYRRAVEIALRARAGEQALTAAKAWRQALPQSKEASELTVQILMALGRPTELAAPLRSLIQLTPTPQQAQTIASLPRSLQRLSDKQAAAQAYDEATQSWRQPPQELAEAWAGSAEVWLRAQKKVRAQTALERAFALNPRLPQIGLLAIDLLDDWPQADNLIRTQLTQADNPSQDVVRLAYARKLTLNQRLSDAAQHMGILVQQHPDNRGHRLLLAAIQLEMRQPDAAEATLSHIITSATESSPSTKDSDLDQAYLMMAQAEELRRHPSQAIQWLDRADPRREKLPIQTQRARLMATQGHLANARQALRQLPETEPRDAILKYQAEAQILRDARQWQDAYQVLAEATTRFPDEADLLYDQALLADRLQRLDDMERLLKKVIELAPDNANALNALGYSLADRGIRLDEARKLIEQALQVRPGDPFISDSLGWLHYRQGQLSEALRLLQFAYKARPDAEIAAHLGEVLWQSGQKETAQTIWQDGLKQEPGNETLQKTIQRLSAPKP